MLAFSATVYNLSLKTTESQLTIPDSTSSHYPYKSMAIAASSYRSSLLSRVNSAFKIGKTPTVSTPQIKLTKSVAFDPQVQGILIDSSIRVGKTKDEDSTKIQALLKKSCLKGSLNPISLLEVKKDCFCKENHRVILGSLVLEDRIQKGHRSIYLRSSKDRFLWELDRYGLSTELLKNDVSFSSLLIHKRYNPDFTPSLDQLEKSISQAILSLEGCFSILSDDFETLSDHLSLMICHFFQFLKDSQIPCGEDIWNILELSLKNCIKAQPYQKHDIDLDTFKLLIQIKGNLAGQARRSHYDLLSIAAQSLKSPTDDLASKFLQLQESLNKELKSLSEPEYLSNISFKLNSKIPSSLTKAKEFDALHAAFLSDSWDEKETKQISSSLHGEEDVSVIETLIESILKLANLKEVIMMWVGE